ncbi:MAG: amino acid ABC transporter ATP-binding protein [Desulfobacterales bacterium]|nr:amino acid ABC transporter ATP-binding protein [Desulfobacterales bacterium]
MIKVTGLAKRFGELTVLKKIDAHVKKGECIAIIGPSGTGKSVFLRTLAMLEIPDSGTILINGTDITKKKTNLNHIREKIGMVYQGFHLFSHLNVLDNITLAPRWVKKKNKMNAEKEAFKILSMVGLVDKVKSYPNELSGGQQQRIAIARCLAMEPEIILFDEPTSSLDPTMTSEVLAIIRKLGKMGLTMLIVTHEIDFVKDIVGRVYYMDEGIIYEEGSPIDIFANPKKEKTRAFINKLKTFNFEIHSASFDMIAMNAQIEMFCQKYNIKAKQIYHIQLILEELIMEILKNCYKVLQPDMEFTLAYAEETDEISIHMTYSANIFNPFEFSVDYVDNLGIILINKISRQREHIFKNGQNQLNIKL